MGYSFKTKNTKSKATFVRKEYTSFCNLKLQIIRLAQGHWTLLCQLTKTAIFIATPMKKIYLAVHFTKVYLFVNLLTERLCV